MLPNAQQRLIALLTWLVVGIWTLVVGGSLAWTARDIEKEAMKRAYAEARANLRAIALGHH